MKKFVVLFILFLSVNVFAQFENVINIDKRMDINKYSYIYNDFKDIEKYNNHPLIYSFEKTSKIMKFQRSFKENGKFVKKDTSYKVVGEKDLNFHGLKIQNILIRNEVFNSLDKPYREKGSLIVDKDNNILFYIKFLWDYKVFPNKLMILHGGENGISVFYMYYKNNKPFYGVNMGLPKFISGHTGIGYIRDGKILGENYIKCFDEQKVTEIYRVINSKYDYEENSKLGRKTIINDKEYTYPEKMNLIWYGAEDSSKLKEFNINKPFSVRKDYDLRAYDFIDSLYEPNMLEIYNK